MTEILLKFHDQEWKFFLRDEADQSVMREIFKIREYKIAEEKIEEAKNIVDVGAHAGFFSIYCRSLNKETKVFAIEPEVNNLKTLEKHLKVNKVKGVKVITGALARESGKAQLAVSADSHNHRLVENGDYAVTAWSLKDFCINEKIKKIDVLKMDIEGGEYEVFAGMNENDFKMVHTFILEYHNQGGKNYKELEARLRENGFGVQIFPSKFDKTMGFLFAVNKRSI